MKTLIILLLTVCCGPVSFAQSTNAAADVQVVQQIFWDSLPAPVGFTNDMENLFTDTQIAHLDSLIGAFEQQTTIEVGIVTVDTVHIAQEKFDDLAVHIANTWGVGKIDKDNGILIAISRGHARIRISNGKGITKILSDEETAAIIDDYFIPYYKKGDYYGGTENGLLQLIAVLKKKGN